MQFRGVEYNPKESNGEKEVEYSPKESNNI